MSTPTEDKVDAVRDAALDETLAATFPASDPLSTNPNPGPSDEPIGDGGEQAPSVPRSPQALSPRAAGTGAHDRTIDCASSSHRHGTA